MFLKIISVGGGILFLILIVVVIVGNLFFGESKPGTNSDDGYHHGHTYE